MIWFALWSVLVVAAAVVVFLLVRRVVRAGLGLVTELGLASQRLSAISAQVDRLGEPATPAAPAIFDDPVELRRARDRRRRAARRRRR